MKAHMHTSFTTHISSKSIKWSRYEIQRTNIRGTPIYVVHPKLGLCPPNVVKFFISLSNKESSNLQCHCYNLPFSFLYSLFYRDYFKTSTTYSWTINRYSSYFNYTGLSCKD